MVPKCSNIDIKASIHDFNTYTYFGTSNLDFFENFSKIFCTPKLLHTYRFLNKKFPRSSKVYEQSRDKLFYLDYQIL